MRRAPGPGNRWGAREEMAVTGTWKPGTLGPEGSERGSEALEMPRGLARSPVSGIRRQSSRAARADSGARENRGGVAPLEQEGDGLVQ